MSKDEKVSEVKVVLPGEPMDLRAIHMFAGVFIDGKRLPVKGIYFDLDVDGTEVFNLQIPARYVTLATV